MGIVIKDNVIMGQKVDSYSRLSHTGTLDLRTGTVILVTDNFMTEKYSKEEGSTPIDQTQVPVILKGKDLEDVQKIFNKLLHKSEKFKKGVKK